MKLNEKQLKVYLEEVAEASVNILESYESINNMIKLYESTEDTLSDYEFGETYNQAAYYNLLLACKARIVSRMEVLKYVLNTLLDAYEDLTMKDEVGDCDCDCGCNGVCTDCEHYDVVSWDLFGILGLGEDEYECEESDEDADDDVVFTLSFDPETVDRDSFKTIVESIYNKVYKGEKVGNNTQTGKKSEGARESVGSRVGYRTTKSNNKKAGTVRKSSATKDEGTDSKKKRKKSTDATK